MAEYEVSPDGNPITKANARFVIWWDSKNKAWADTEDITSPVKWVLWEISWPLLLLSQALFVVYRVLSGIVLRPVKWVW